jgi:hypothetical protein
MICLYGCFSKPPDVVTAAAGGRRRSAALWVCHTAPLSGVPVRARIRGWKGPHKPSNMASVAVRLWALVRELRGKHNILGPAETTV